MGKSLRWIEVRNTQIILFSAFAVLLMLVQPMNAVVPDKWKTGDEGKILNGHTFQEEMFTTEVSNTTKDGADVSFTVSYLNFNEVQAFLVAFNQWEKNGNRSTLPYQLFGMHYYTPKGREVFISAALAFLMAYNNTHNPEAGLPDPGSEKVFYIIPFGIGNVLKNGSYLPEVEPIEVQKIGEGHYRFGMRYTNLYAKIISGNNALGMILSTALPLYIAKFSELEVRYDVYVDAETGQCRAESHYTIGAVEKLWLWGKEVPPSTISPDMGIAVVHYLSIFASNFRWAGSSTGNKYTPGTETPLSDNLTMSVGGDDERALSLRFSGNYSIMDNTDNVIGNGTARKMLVKPRASDKLLVGWQSGLSKDILVTMAYALSRQVRSTYKTPKLFESLAWLTFTGTNLWYGVAFPNWGGNKIYYDPTYTGYFGDVPEEQPVANTPGFTTMLVAAVLGLSVIAVYSRRRRN